MHIAVLLTFEQSLSKWKKNGHFDREIFYYKNLYKKYNIKTTFISYGLNSEKKLISQYHYLNIIPIYEKLKFSNFFIIRFIKSFFLYFYINKDLKNIDIIKSNQLWGTWTLFLFKFFTKKKILIRCGYELNQNLEYEKDKFFLKIFSKLCSFIIYQVSDHIIVTTLDIKNYIEKTFRVKKKITIIPNYIDVLKFKPTNIKQYNNKILFVGRNSREKNISFLLNAIKNLPISLDILGSGFTRKNLIALKKKYNISINYLRPTPNEKMPNVYNKYKLYISTSDYEGNPKSILEAMACGCIVIARNVQGCNSVITNGFNGFLVKNYLELRHIVKKNILKKNYKMKKNAIHFIQMKYNFDIISKKETRVLKFVKNEKNNNNVISKKMWLNSYF
jgi:glycosyltransferase involved in cell wall biosynthesis